MAPNGNYSAVYNKSPSPIRNYKREISYSRGPNWSTVEIRVLCNYIKENYFKFFGIRGSGSKGITAIQQKHWSRVTDEINQVSSQKRLPKQVRKKWTDLVYAIRHSSKRKIMDEEILEEVQKTFRDINERYEGEVNSDNDNVDVLTSNHQTVSRQLYYQESDRNESSISSSTSSSSTCLLRKLGRKRKRPPQQQFIKTEEDSDFSSVDDDIEQRPRKKISRDFEIEDSIEYEKLIIAREKIQLKRQSLKVKKDMLVMQENIYNCVKDISKCMKLYIRDNIKNK